VNFSVFKEGWYTGERELPVICRVAEQTLSIEVSYLPLQLDYGGRTREDILGSRKRIGPNIPVSQNPVKCVYLLPKAVYLRKVCGGHLPSTDGLTRSMAVMAFLQRPSYNDLG